MRKIIFTKEQTRPQEHFQRIKRRAQRFDSNFLKGVGVTDVLRNGNTLTPEYGESSVLEIKRIKVSLKQP